MLYLLGIHHDIQSPETRLSFIFGTDEYKQLIIETTKKYKKVLDELITTKNIQVIGEELNNYDNEPESYFMTWEICEQHHIKHLFCDPSREEQNQMGIVRGGTDEADNFEKNYEKNHTLREQYRLNKIEPYKSQNIVFVCGNKHIPTFTKKLQDNDRRFETIDNKFCEELLNYKF